MSYPRKSVLMFALAIGASLLAGHSALAQRDAGAKIRGEHSVPFWSSRSSARRITAAHDYARDFQRYLAVNPKPDPAVVKEVTTQIGNSLEEAKKHLAQLKKDFAGKKEAVAGIESLDKDLAGAFEHHQLLCDCCEKESFDKIKTMECCADLAKHLDKILTDHDALMHKLSPPPASPAKKGK
jgi:hypothetical protein